ncbi:MAG TPA: pyridoxamine 5'-phosphate oxidase family protein [Phycicoccus sp.]|jgi:nitroimidazol reductase NimA-like FMN-containing flavoprotein (pyridoxamine 5'-phosphate oxidase superfamily)
MTEHSPVIPLSEDECWEMLHGQEFGRLAFHLASEVHIVPINYAVDPERRLVFRTAEGSKLLGLTMNADVAFEIDEFTEEAARSVVVRGRARQLEGHEVDETEQLPLRPWVDTAKFNVIAVEVDEVTGRRFELTRPWLHMRPVEEDV